MRPSPRLVNPPKVDKGGGLSALGRSGQSFMHFVYILKSGKNGKLYKGSTSDLKRRLKEHNSGKENFTKDGIPWKLIYYECFSNKEDAFREEKFLKSGKGRERIKFLLKYTLE